MDNQKLEAVQSVLKLFDSTKSMEEVTAILKQGVALLQTIKGEMQSERSQLHAAAEEAIARIQKKADALREPTDELLRSLIKPLIPPAQHGVTPVKGVDYFDGVTPVKGVDYFDGAPGDIKDLSPEELRDSLELITNEDDKLKISAIGHLQEELDKLRKSIGKGGAVFASSRGQVKVYDLSALLDGVTKTFALPAFWRVLTVDLSSFPNALRPTTDFTTDASLMTITFTSQVDAATALASGQTCIVTYAEA